MWTGPHLISFCSCIKAQLRNTGKNMIAIVQQSSFAANHMDLNQWFSWRLYKSLFYFHALSWFKQSHLVHKYYSSTILWNKKIKRIITEHKQKENSQMDLCRIWRQKLTDLQWTAVALIENKWPWVCFITVSRSMCDRLLILIQSQTQPLWDLFQIALGSLGYLKGESGGIFTIYYTNMLNIVTYVCGYWWKL